MVLEKELPVSSLGGRAGCVDRPGDHEVLPYLQTLFERATAKRNKEDRKAINHLLNIFQDVFSKDEYDLGKTYMVEH